MLRVALALIVALALLAFAAAIVVLRSRRHRFGRGAPLTPALDPLPAGLKHLATTVIDRSGMELHLAARPPGATRKPRLALLLGLR